MTWSGGVGGPGEAAGRDKMAVLPAGVAEAVRAAVHEEFDQVLHHVVEALRRN